MKRYGLLLRQKASVARKYSDQLIDQLESFVLHVCCFAMKQPYDAAYIIAIDESPVWADTISATTVEDSPFIVFKGAK